MTRGRTVTFGLIATALSLAAAAGVAEVLLRVFRPVEYLAPPGNRPGESWRGLLHQASSTPGLDYELAPGAERQLPRVRVTTNAHGMRDDEPLSDDTPELLRIAVVGDSFTFGFGVEADEAYPAVLERLLVERHGAGGRAFDVLNLGVGGYNAANYAAVVRHKALAWRPRLIVIGYVLNDPETEPVQPLHAHFAPTAWWRHSHLLRLLAEARAQWSIRRIGEGDYFAYLHAPEREPWTGVERAFDDIGAATTPSGTPVLLAVFPITPDDWSRYPYSPLHDQVRAAAETAGLDSVDLLDALAALPPELARVVPGDDHPSMLGHRAIAEALYHEIVDRYGDRLDLPTTGEER